jgi:trimethylamine---corrinoid protein Co-methyltransferase
LPVAAQRDIVRAHNQAAECAPRDGLEAGNLGEPFVNHPWTWHVLSEAQLDRIHGAALQYIARQGFVVQHQGLLARARSRGASVSEADGRVRVSRELYSELMAAVPAHYTIRNMLGETWEIGGARQLGNAIVTDPWIIDYATGQPRRPCLEDLRRHTLIAEQLDPVAAISRMDFPVTDEPGPTSSLRALETHLLNHTRHYMVMAASQESFDQWLDLAPILSRGGDVSRLFSSGIAVGSPMVLNELNGDLLTRTVEMDFAVVPTVCPMAGSTSPYSLAGTLLQSHIEVLMVTLLTQMLRPGHPVQYVSGLSVTDMRNGADLYYTMDKVLWKTAAVQLGLALNMPVGAECGGTLTHRCDPQCGAEGMLFMLAAHASGAHLLSGFGSCHNAIGMSAEMMVIQQAYLRAARHLARGIRTDDPFMGLASLERVGSGGQFLDDDLTVQLLRSDEFFQDDVFDLGGDQGDGRGILERAHERVEQMLSGYTPRVPGDVQEGLRRYFHDLCRRTR